MKRTEWLQYLGSEGSYSFGMILHSDTSPDMDKVREVARDKPTKKLLKKLGVPEDLIKECLAAVF